ncbi:MAG: hypothetical protein ABSC36_00535 [Gaiellaceae bacterium]
MSLSRVQIRTREDALVWQLVDAVFSGGDAVALCRQFELDLYREQSEAVLVLEHRERLLAILRDTDPTREAAIA